MNLLGNTGRGYVSVIAKGKEGAECMLNLLEVLHAAGCLQYDSMQVALVLEVVKERVSV